MVATVRLFVPGETETENLRPERITTCTRRDATSPLIYSLINYGDKTGARVPD